MNSGSTFAERGMGCSFLTVNHLKVPKCHVYTPKPNNPESQNTGGTSYIMCRFHIKGLFRKNILYIVFKIYFNFFAIV